MNYWDCERLLDEIAEIKAATKRIVNKLEQEEEINISYDIEDIECALSSMSNLIQLEKLRRV